MARYLYNVSTRVWYNISAQCYLIWENIFDRGQKAFTIRLSIFLTLARACDKRFSADHDTMLSLLIKAFGPWAFTFYQTVFFVVFSEGKWSKHLVTLLFQIINPQNQRICMR